MSSRRSFTFVLAIFASFLSTTVHAQRHPMCDAFNQSSQSLVNSNDRIRALKAYWQQYQHEDKLPKSQFTHADKSCLALWYGAVQGIPASLLEASAIPIEPDHAWMWLDAELAYSERGLREARAKQDSKWEQNYLAGLEVFSHTQEHLRPNFVKVVIVNPDSSEADWSPVAQMTSRSVFATLRNAIISAKLYSKDHELIWEGQFNAEKLGPHGGQYTEIGAGKLLLRKSVATVEVSDVQFAFEHQMR